MSAFFKRIGSLSRGTTKLSLYDTGTPGDLRFRLMKESWDGPTQRFDTWVGPYDREFRELLKGKWVHWKDPHGHQVVKVDTSSGQPAEKEYLRLPPHPMTGNKEEVVIEKKK
jgi:hypothetical protein